jgi:hypothetical protein
MKTHLFTYSAILLGGFMLTACTEDRDPTAKTTEVIQENRQEMSKARSEGGEEWREERTEAIKELRDLRATLVTRQEREQKQLNDGIKDTNKKTASQAMVTELGVNIARIDASLMKLESSTGTDWNNVKGDARKAADETRTWWDRQTDKLDDNTDKNKDRY